MLQSPTDKVFAHESYTIHYRRVRRVAWLSEARPNYTALFLLRGALRWRSDEATGECNDESALLAAPGETLAARGAQAECLLLTLTPAFVLDCAVRARLTRDDARISFRAPSVASDVRLARLAHDLADELHEAEPGHELVVAALVEQIVVHLLRRHANVRRDEGLELARVGLVDRRVRRAVELMHAHLDEDLPLEELAAAAYLSPFHFARLFKKVTGASPHAYLAALRLDRAAILLATTDLAVTIVSERVGYADSSHFGRAFRHSHGLSPSAFRKALVSRQSARSNSAT